MRISHSTIKQLIQCPRRVLYERELRIAPQYGSIAMKYGSGFHKGMEAYYKNGKDINAALEKAAEFWNTPHPQTFIEDYRNLDNLLASLIQYHEFNKANEEVVASPEMEIVTPIELTDKEREVYGELEINFVVIIDLILKSDNLKWVVDFKTTAFDLAYMISRLSKMPQLMGYQFIAQEKFDDISGCMVFYHQLKATKSRKTGLYGDPTRDFKKFPIIYGSQDYSQWRDYIVWHAAQLSKAKEAGYPPNFNSCYEFNRTCPYINLCNHPSWNLERVIELFGSGEIDECQDVANSSGYVILPPKEKESNTTED